MSAVAVENYVECVLSERFLNQLLIDIYKQRVRVLDIIHV